MEMNARESLTRYLLNEVSEPEREAIERAYFENPQAFEAMAQAETALIDDYVRERLAPDVRRRFETAYLADPARRARVAFAEALAARVDRLAAPGFDSQTAPAAATVRVRRSWLPPFFHARPALALAAAAMIAVLATAVWMALDRRSGGSAVPAHAGAGRPEAPGTPAAPAAGTLPTRPAPVVVTLALVVGAGERRVGPEGPATLTIPRDATDVRFALTLRARDYGRYRVILRMAGGSEILRRDDLQPIVDPAGPVIELRVPANAFTSADYILALQGAARDGEFDDLSQTIIRVDKP
jgi:hypothetical protein